MALTKQGWIVDVTLIDKGANETTRRFPLVATDDAGDVSALITFVTGTLLVNLAAVTQAVVKKWTLQVVYLETALSLPVGDGAEIEAHALITAPIYGLPNKSAVVDIPAPEDILFLDSSGPGYNIVDTSVAELTAYVGMFTFVGDKIYISDGEQLDSAGWRGRRTHSKSSRG